ncbi:MAG TPA: PIN domain-containing protein, partial [Geomonas sp.]
MKKIYVLDTNVLLYDPQALGRFKDNSIIIPITVIEEIDRFKKDMNETGRNARQVSRIMDAFRKVGSLSKGVPLENGGTLRIEIYEEKVMKRLPPELREERGDNRILAVAVDLMETGPAVPVILVTKDTNLRIKADALGLAAQEYESDKVAIDDLFTGAASLEVEADLIDR